MATSILVDAGSLIALLSRRDRHHKWAVTQSPGLPPPWKTCDAVLSEAFHLLGSRGRPSWKDPERVLAEMTPCQQANAVDPARAREVVARLFPA